MKPRSAVGGRGFQKDGQGSLYLVGTPIGNLEDITLRALRSLREADLIACEDTRQTQKLLDHYQIETPVTSYHEHNEMVRAPELVMRLEEGAHIALVSDAGMPGISDPGYRLVGLCIRHGVPVVPVPGPSAFVCALVASGLPVHSFHFFGFLPSKQNARRKLLQQMRESAVTAIFFESPHRLLDALEDVLEVLGNRPTVVAREMTKIHEEFIRGSCSEVLQGLRSRDSIPGEITLLVAGAGAEETTTVHTQPLKDRVVELMQNGIDRMEALKMVARERHISKSRAYREFES